MIFRNLKLGTYEKRDILFSASLRYITLPPNINYLKFLLRGKNRTLVKYSYTAE